MDSNNKPLLSHIVAGRNDNYLGNFKQRLEMMINYICKNVAETGNLENYELIICDWNSEKPLREAIYLSKEALACVRFVEVPPEIVKKKALDKASPFLISHATNTAMRHAQADMIMLSPCDVLFPHQSIKSLFSLLKGEIPCPVDIKDCYMGIERFLIPWQLSERMTLDSIDRDLFLYTNAMQMEETFHGWAGGEGAHLISKKILTELRGYDESYVYWGAQEVQLARRINQFAPTVKATMFGIFCYDLQQAPIVRSVIKSNLDVVSESPLVNDENWGLHDEKDIVLTSAVALDRKPNSSAAEREPYVNTMVEKPFSILITKALYYCNNSTSKVLAKVFNIGAICRTFIIRKIIMKALSHCNNPSYPSLSKFFNNGVKYLRFLRLNGFYAAIVMEFLVHTWINAKKTTESTIYISDFFDKAKLEVYLLNIFAKGKFNFKKYENIQEACTSIALLSVVAALRPTRFLDLYTHNFIPIQTMALADPCMIITSYDNWINSKKRGNSLPTSRIMEYEYQGYLHILTGPQETALERLTKIQLVNEAYDTVFLDLDFWPSFSALDVTKLNSILAPKCAIVATVDTTKWAAMDNLEKELEKYNFKIEANLYEVCIFVRK